jgi:general stress protein YciG
MKNPNAVALGKLGGKAGKGKAKARDPGKMSEAGKKGAQARWGSNNVSELR